MSHLCAAKVFLAGTQTSLRRSVPVAGTERGTVQAPVPKFPRRGSEESGPEIPIIDIDEIYINLEILQLRRNSEKAH